MSLNKKILATAIVGGLFATAAQAQVTLSTTGAAAGTVRLASEISLPATINFTGGNAALDNLHTALGFNFSDGDVKHARLECSSNVRITSIGSASATPSTAPVLFSSADNPTATPPVVGVPVTPAFYSISSANGLNSNAVFFSITDVSGDGQVLNSGMELRIQPTIEVRSPGNVACSFALYDTSSQASIGGATGRIATTITSGNYATFGSSFGYAIQTGGATISTAAPIFTSFTAVTGATSSGVARLTGSGGATVAGLNFGLLDVTTGLPTSVATSARRTATGANITMVDLFGPASAHVIEGDMSALANADGTFTGDALTRIYLDNDNNCTNTAPTAAVRFRYPVSMTATSATFETGTTALLDNVNGVCFARRSGVTIPESGYTIRFVPQPASASVNPSAISATAVGSLVRDGVTLQAPLVQVPTGWISRIALTNTSAVSRPYTISVTGETGNTITTNASNLTGNIPANGTVVVDLPSVLTGFTGASRATLSVSIAAPNTSVQGLYQIVNASTGSISNHVMVRPGSN